MAAWRQRNRHQQSKSGGNIKHQRRGVASIENSKMAHPSLARWRASRAALAW